MQKQEILPALRRNDDSVTYTPSRTAGKQTHTLCSLLNPVCAASCFSVGSGKTATVCSNKMIKKEFGLLYDSVLINQIISMS